MEEHFTPLSASVYRQIFIDICRTLEVPETIEMKDTVALFIER